MESPSTAMAAPLDQDPWSTGPAVAELLEREPYRFNFFQAVRILERLDSRRRPIGTDAHPNQECVRLHTLASLVFPPSDLSAYHPPDDAGGPPGLTVAFMGLIGPAGALPRFYTELVLERQRHKDTTLRDFLDLFNHRLLSLFYRAWKKYRFWLAYEDAERIGQRDYAADDAHWRSFVTEVRPRVDGFSQALLDLAAAGTPSLRYRATVRGALAARTGVSDLTLRYYAGLLSDSRRSAQGLQLLLEGHFDVPVGIEQAVGRWLVVEPDDQTRLGAGCEAALGTNAMVGARFWDLQGKFRVRLGPLTYAQYEAFLPPGAAHRQLADLVFIYVGMQLDAELQLVLRGDEVPWCGLGASDQPAARLGWNTWIRNAPFTGPRADAILSIESAASGAAP